MHWYDAILQKQRANKLKTNDELDQETRMIGTSPLSEEDYKHSDEGRDLTQDTTPFDEDAPF